MATSILNVENASKSFQNKRLFHKANFFMQEGEKVALIGKNGGGKSTLLRIIAGKEELDEGTVVKKRGLKLAYLPQETRFSEEEELLPALCKSFTEEIPETEKEAMGKRILQELGFSDFTISCAKLSGGQKKQLALLSVLSVAPDLLLLDEPTNHIDEEVSEWLEERLKRFKGSILLVTHDRYFLDGICSRIVELDREQFISYDCKYDAYLEEKAERLSGELAKERARQNLLRKELAWVRRGAKARSTKQKARLDRYEKLSSMHGPTEEEELQLSSVFTRLGKSTILIEDLGKSYGDKLLFSHFDYHFLRNDRIGIVGKNGVGKSTLMKTIFGEIPPDTGRVECGQTVRIAYFRQENEELNEKERVIDSIRDIADYLPTTDGLISASQMAERFLFTPEMQFAPIEKLSGGEKRRLYLLRILMSAPNVLFLDEPTNDLDISSLMVLEDFLDHFAGIVLTISHDRYFLDRTVNRLFVFEGDGHIRRFEGGYTDYQVQLLRESKEQEVESVKSGEKERKENSAPSSEKSWKKERALKMSYQEKKDYETIEEEISRLEEKVQELDRESAENARDFLRLQEIQKEKEETEKTLTEKWERWEYLSALQEKIEAGEKKAY
nr:ABC-F family ATP-binding cassette domain-containing protein [uncultured Oribacterium sp.]